MAEKTSYPTWPGWETERLIGRGSFGAVYEIRREVFGDTEKAALKVISIPQSESDITEMLGDGYDEASITETLETHLKSIVAEYSLMRKMNGCANVVNCDDLRYEAHKNGYGWDIFIKMELLTPLTSALPSEIPEEQAVKIGRDLSRALTACEQFNIVHRDIKPQNIFVSPLGDYKLGDFGIAKTVEKTSGGTKIGTYKYMAPEVYNNQPYGARADIYSLGLVLYWLLNERRMPFLPLPPEKLSAGMEEASRLRRFRGEALPAPAHGSPELQRIVLKACAFDPKERYQSAAELLRELEKLDFVRRNLAWKLEDKAEAVPEVAISTPPAAEIPGGPSGPDAGSREKNEQTDQDFACEETPAKPKKKTGLVPALCFVAAAALLIVLLPRLGGRAAKDAATQEPSEQAEEMAEETPAEQAEETATEAPSEWIEGNWDWRLEDGVLTITGSGNMANVSDSLSEPWIQEREKITRVAIENGITGIGANEFAGLYSVTTVEIPKSVTSIGEGAFSYCRSLTAIEVDSDNPCFSTRAGALFTKEGQVLLCYPAGNDNAEYTIPAGVTSIGNWAFRGCNNLTRIKIPAGVTSIDVVGFVDCNGLTWIDVEDGNKNYSSDDGILLSKDGRELLYCPEGYDLPVVVLPAGVTSLGAWSFSLCRNLKSIHLPNSVTSIDDLAFFGCENLTDVFYSGTEEQWKTILGEEGNYALQRAVIHYEGQ